MGEARRRREDEESICTRLQSIARMLIISLGAAQISNRKCTVVEHEKSKFLVKREPVECTQHTHDGIPVRSNFRRKMADAPMDPDDDDGENCVFNLYALNVKKRNKP